LVFRWTIETRLEDTAARDRSPPGLPTMVAGDSARGLVISPTDEAQQEEILVSRYRNFLFKKMRT
jgi:hypothetical protein